MLQGWQAVCTYSGISISSHYPTFSFVSSVRDHALSSRIVIEASEALFPFHPSTEIEYCTMSRAVADATRFTATSPHANSNPLPAASRVYPRNGSRPLPRASLPQASRSPGPPGETPKEKVAWLRAEWRAKNIPKPPLWDRIVVRGRDIADTAHQWTVLGILGFTGALLPYPLPTVRS